MGVAARRRQPCGKSIKLGLLGFVMGGAWIAAGSLWGGVWAQRATPLNAVAQGEWQLSEIDGPGRMSVCVADPGALLRLRQSNNACALFVLDSDRSSVTVRYTRGGTGHGRSVLTVRSAHSIELETQGVTGGRRSPFPAAIANTVPAAMRSSSTYRMLSLSIRTDARRGPTPRSSEESCQDC